MPPAEFNPVTRHRRALRQYQLGAFALAGLAVALAAVLLPRGDELLLIHVRNHDIERARAVLADASRQRLSTAASVVAHDELYLLEGRVDEALVAMEAYAEARPDDVEAWSRLARMYADAQRLDDQVRAGAHVYRRQPTTARARQLAVLYRWNGDEDAEAGVLHDVVAGGTATVDESLRSARLDAALGRPDRALATLDRLHRDNAGAFDYAALELYAALIVERRGTANLALPIGLVPLTIVEPDVVVQLARAFVAWGRADAAVALFDSPAGTEAPAHRLAMRARIAMGTSEAPRVLHDLAAADLRRPLAADALDAFVDLALSIGDLDSAEAVLANPARVPPPALVGRVIGHLVAQGDTGRAQSLVARMGDAGLAESPMLALRLAAERGDLIAAERWIAELDASGSSPEQEAAVAQHEARLGLGRRAFDRLAALAVAGTTPDWAATDLAALAVETGRVDEALETLSASASPGARAAWARLAATAGRAGAIETWLSDRAKAPLDWGLLRDVYFLLADRGHVRVARLAARYLFDGRGTHEDALLYGEALLAAGDPVEALTPLRRLDAARSDGTLAYDAALVGALHAGADVAAELRQVFTRRLGDAGLPDEHRALLVEGLWAAGERAALAAEIQALAARDLTRWLAALVESAVAAGDTAPAAALVAAHLDADGEGEGTADGESGGLARADLVYALLALDASDETVLPWLEHLAFDEGGTWVYAYDERLARGAHADARVDLWRRIGGEPGRPVDERRAAAARLAEMGATTSAMAVLEPLAERAGPDDSDVLQLLSLWGPRPEASHVQWLVRRLAAAPDAERPAWIDHVVRAGGARFVASVMPTLPVHASPRLVEAWVNAHQAMEDRWPLRDALQQVFLRTSATLDELRLVGRAALANEFAGLAADAFAAIASRAPGDAEALRWLGALAFYDGRRSDARARLEAYVSGGGDEAEPLYQLGEIALSDDDAERARTYFLRARERLEAGPGVQPALLANVLVRLDERERAAAAYERMLAEEPGLDHVRADYVVAALEWADYDRARRLLDGAPGGGDSLAGAQGARRLDLLRVQVMTHDGDYAGALRLLESLGTRFPTDADVLLARAGFDEGRGRPAAADRGYEQARDAAPSRDDIARLVDERVRRQSPRAGLETEVRSISGGWDETYQRLTARGTAWSQSPATLTVERLRLSAPQVRRADGQVVVVDSDLSRFEAGMMGRVAPATTVGGAVFGTAHGLGVGVTATHDDLRGRTELTAEIGRPFWEFLESAVDDGRRDRVGVQRQWRFRPDTAAWAQAGWHRYRLASGPRAETAALTFGVVRTIREAAPALTLQYGLDKEQRLRATVSATPGGEAFVPVPLLSREVHLFGAITRFPMASLWEVEATGGYTLDRLGGRGSFATIRLTPPAGARVGVELWADRRLFAVVTTQRAVRAGLRVQVRF